MTGVVVLRGAHAPPPGAAGPVGGDARGRLQRDGALVYTLWQTPRGCSVLAAVYCVCVCVCVVRAVLARLCGSRQD